MHLHCSISLVAMSHIEDWEKASGKERQLIFKAAAREAKVLAPKMDKELLKERKYTYRQWFHNHKKVQTNSKAPTKPKKKWTAWRVIEEERKAEILQQIREEIEEETGEKPAHKEVLRRYQPTMTAIMHRLDKKELQEAEAKADKWTNQAPNATVQAKTARKKGKKMVKNFAKEMFTQAGMRVFVLGSWMDEKGGLLTSGTYLPDDTKILEPSKMFHTDANAILDFWWDRQETQVGPTFKFKAWMDEKGRMCSPVAEDESDGDANDESTSARPTRKPSATTTLSLTSIPKGRLSSTKRPYISSTEEECEKTEAEASPPAVQQRLHCHANAEDTDRSDDQLVPKSFGNPLKPAMLPAPSAQGQLARVWKLAKVWNTFVHRR
ncbi:hypothetical protein F4604DRAFT_1692589 [Suillus subluteus]|nr:hypothetical protein F4604DRAFT_1692589 [Suillus subluteus]